MTLEGKFTTVKTETYNTLRAATMAVENYAKENNYTNVKCVEEEDGWAFRWTARTPNGRNGRNIAFCDGPGPDEA